MSSKARKARKKFVAESAEDFKATLEKWIDSSFDDDENARLANMLANQGREYKAYSRVGGSSIKWLKRKLQPVQKGRARGAK